MGQHHSSVQTDFEHQLSPTLVSELSTSTSDVVIESPTGHSRSRLEARESLRNQLFSTSTDELKSFTSDSPNTSQASRVVRLKDGTVISFCDIASLLQEFRQSASPEELATLQKALSDGVASSPGLSPDHSPDKLLGGSKATMTRRSSLFGALPGVATRDGHAKLQKKQSSSRKLRKSITQTWSPEDFTQSPLEQLAGLNSTSAGADAPQLSRENTPYKEQYSQLGMHKPGSLRVTNGVASPEPSISPRVNGLDSKTSFNISEVELNLDHKVDSIPLMDNCTNENLTVPKATPEENQQMSAETGALKKSENHNAAPALRPAITRQDTDESFVNTLVEPLTPYLLEASSNPYLPNFSSSENISKSQTYQTTHHLARATVGATYSSKPADRVRDDAESLYSDHSSDSPPALEANRVDALRQLTGAEHDSAGQITDNATLQVPARPKKKSSFSSLIVQDSDVAPSTPNSDFSGSNRLSVSNSQDTSIKEKPKQRPKKLQKKKGVSDRNLRASIVVQHQRDPNAVPMIPQDVKSHYSNRISQNPTMEHLEHTFESVATYDSPKPISPIGDNGDRFEIRFPSPTPSAESPPSSVRGRRDCRSFQESHNGSSPHRFLRRLSGKGQDNSRSRSRPRDNEPEVPSFANFGTVAESLGASPYDIASSTTRSSRPKVGSANLVQPHHMSTRMSRVKSAQGMDDETAARIARRKSRDRVTNYEAGSDLWLSDNPYDASSEIRKSGEAKRRSSRSQLRGIQTTMEHADTSPNPPCDPRALSSIGVTSDRREEMALQAEDSDYGANETDRESSLPRAPKATHDATSTDDSWEVQAKLWRQKRNSISDGLRDREQQQEKEQMQLLRGAGATKETNPQARPPSRRGTERRTVDAKEHDENLHDGDEPFRRHVSKLERHESLTEEQPLFLTPLTSSSEFPPLRPDDSRQVQSPSPTVKERAAVFEGMYDHNKAFPPTSPIPLSQHEQGEKTNYAKQEMPRDSHRETTILNSNHKKQTHKLKSALKKTSASRFGDAKSTEPRLSIAAVPNVLRQAS